MEQNSAENSKYNGYKGSGAAVPVSGAEDAVEIREGSDYVSFLSEEAVFGTLPSAEDFREEYEGARKDKTPDLKYTKENDIQNRRSGYENTSYGNGRTVRENPHAVTKRPESAAQKKPAVNKNLIIIALAAAVLILLIVICIISFKGGGSALKKSVADPETTIEETQEETQKDEENTGLKTPTAETTSEADTETVTETTAAPETEPDDADDVISDGQL